MVFELNAQTIVISVGTLWALYKAICWVLDRYHIGEKRKEYYLIREADKTLMREVLRWAHKETTAAGYIDEDELTHLELTHSIYKGLGGNGTGDRWMEEMRKLPRKKD